MGTAADLIQRDPLNCRVQLIEINLQWCECDYGDSPALTGPMVSQIGGVPLRRWKES